MNVQKMRKYAAKRPRPELPPYSYGPDIMEWEAVAVMERLVRARHYEFGPHVTLTKERGRITARGVWRKQFPEPHRPGSSQ